MLIPEDQEVELGAQVLAEVLSEAGSEVTSPHRELVQPINGKRKSRSLSAFADCRSAGRAIPAVHLIPTPAANLEKP